MDRGPLPRLYHRTVRRSLTLDDLRRFAVTRSLFTPTSLARAIDKLAFVQADPIRAPARAQDLTLRHRVRGYRAGDLERRYASLGIEEDVFINYGFLPRSVQALMHPRARAPARSTVAASARCWTSSRSAASSIRAKWTPTSRTGP